MTYLICLLSVMIYILNCEEFIYGTFEDCIALRNSHYCSSYFKISTRHSRYYDNPPKVSEDSDCKK